MLALEIMTVFYFLSTLAVFFSIFFETSDSRLLCIVSLIYSFCVFYRKHLESGVSLKRTLTRYLLRLRGNYELEEGRPASAHKEFLRMYLQFPGRG